jgi:hypothetical protein
VTDDIMTVDRVSVDGQPPHPINILKSYMMLLESSVSDAIIRIFCPVNSLAATRNLWLT